MGKTIGYYGAWVYHKLVFLSLYDNEDRLRFTITNQNDFPIFNALYDKKGHPRIANTISNDDTALFISQSHKKEIAFGVSSDAKGQISKQIHQTEGEKAWEFTGNAMTVLGIVDKLFSSK